MIYSRFYASSRVRKLALFLGLFFAREEARCSLIEEDLGPALVHLTHTFPREGKIVPPGMVKDSEIEERTYVEEFVPNATAVVHFNGLDILPAVGFFDTYKFPYAVLVPVKSLGERKLLHGHILDIRIFGSLPIPPGSTILFPTAQKRMLATCSIPEVKMISYGEKGLRETLEQILKETYKCSLSLSTHAVEQDTLNTLCVTLRWGDELISLKQEEGVPPKSIYFWEYIKNLNRIEYSTTLYAALQDILSCFFFPYAGILKGQLTEKDFNSTQVDETLTYFLNKLKKFEGEQAATVFRERNTILSKIPVPVEVAKLSREGKISLLTQVTVELATLARATLEEINGQGGGSREDERSLGNFVGKVEYFLKEMEVLYLDLREDILSLSNWRALVRKIKRSSSPAARK